MATVFERVQSLGEIITDAVTAGVDTNVPPREIRNSLVKVATGTYTEVLPIRVPAETCIIGDELRSTNVQPRKATNATLTPRKDFRFSHHALNRLTEIIGDVVVFKDKNVLYGDKLTIDLFSSTSIIMGTEDKQVSVKISQ